MDGQGDLPNRAYSSNPTHPLPAYLPTWLSACLPIYPTSRPPYRPACLPYLLSLPTRCRLSMPLLFIVAVAPPPTCQQSMRPLPSREGLESKG